ncbi:hypothetical protein PSCLAVI8L_50035 [Pseudoclavibacter sp. 8L]|nr:hypothetical protein PSCLAVI8L_50035 [Pseudoclavibacter sp. 8L]
MMRAENRGITVLNIGFAASETFSSTVGIKLVQRGDVQA